MNTTQPYDHGLTDDELNRLHDLVEDSPALQHPIEKMLSNTGELTDDTIVLVASSNRSVSDRSYHSRFCGKLLLSIGNRVENGKRAGIQVWVHNAAREWGMTHCEYCTGKRSDIDSGLVL